MMIIDTQKCTGCGRCVKDCFQQDIEMACGKARLKNIFCKMCGHCIAVCPVNAVSTGICNSGSNGGSNSCSNGDFNNICSVDYSMEDVRDYNKDEFSIEPDRLLNFIKFRRTIRQFKDMEVEDGKLFKIIEAGRFTQTGTNQQEVSYTVIKKDLQQLKALAIDALKQVGEQMLSDLPDPPPLTPQNMTTQKIARKWLSNYKEYHIDPRNDKLFYGAMAVIIIAAPSIIHGGLVYSNMELMANALGLGTLFSGEVMRAAQASEKIVDFLHIAKGKQMAACMLIGYPDVKYLRTVPRKKADIYWK